MAEIRLEGVTKRFGDVVAVDEVSFTGEDREFLALVGPSGCGKTTTLRLIAGLEELTSGEINIGDRRINDILPKDRNIAMVFQNYALYPHMNVYKNISFGLRIRKFSREEIKTQVQQTAKILGIEELLHRKPKELSGGQRQRVAMGRAIVRQPQVFLFDEPLSNLDAKLRVQMRGELAKLRERLQTTMIYVTHDQIEAMTLADRVVIMNEGRIIQMASPREVYRHPKHIFVAGFIGSPAMNFTNARVVGEGDRLFVEGGDFRLSVPESLCERYATAKDREVIWGIRPQHLYDGRLKRPFPGGEPLRVAVEVVQPVGPEVITLARRGANRLTACLGSETDACTNREMDFLIDMNFMHLFDKTSGDAY